MSTTLENFYDFPFSNCDNPDERNHNFANKQLSKCFAETFREKVGCNGVKGECKNSEPGQPGCEDVKKDCMKFWKDDKMLNIDDRRNILTGLWTCNKHKQFTLSIIYIPGVFLLDTITIVFLACNAKRIGTTNIFMFIVYMEFHILFCIFETYRTNMFRMKYIYKIW